MDKNSQTRWRAATAPLQSRFAADLNPANPLPEYPRPQMVRQGPAGDPGWRSLNGLWRFGITRAGAEAARGDREILVPFPIESSLSGVGEPLQPGQCLWMHRTFEVPRPWQDRRVVLHFGAVDWEAHVIVNGKAVGSHRGGFGAFSFDITDALRGDGEQVLQVAVIDPTGKQGQAVGKQSLKPKLVFYSAVSGIWQTVWLESVPEASIRNLRLEPQIGGEEILVTPEISGDPTGLHIRLVAREQAFPEDGAPTPVVAQGETAAGEALSLRPDAPRLWSRTDPHLYGLRAELCRGDQILDTIDSYFGLRWFDIRQDRHGEARLQWNGEPVFQLGPLDQGYWPDGLYTAPTDEALRFDVEQIDQMSFNMVRKHIKVEPMRWYHHCDRLGLAVWQDMPCGKRGSLPFFFWTPWFLATGKHLSDDRMRWRHGRGRRADREAFHVELDEMVHQLRDVPCIAGWVPFNEAWGQFDSAAAVEKIRAIDTSRPIDAASGWFDQGAGDLLTSHHYPSPVAPRDSGSRAQGCSEYGGLGLIEPGHIWEEKQKFVYRMMDSSEALTAEYLRLLDKLRPLIEKGLSQAVYTQITDVEIEVNGLLTYDRAVEKLDLEKITQAHRELLEFARAHTDPAAD